MLCFYCASNRDNSRLTEKEGQNGMLLLVAGVSVTALQSGSHNCASKQRKASIGMHFAFLFTNLITETKISYIMLIKAVSESIIEDNSPIELE